MDPLLGFSLNELMGQPDLASKHGGQIDHMLEVVHWFMTVIGVGWTIFFVIVLFRFNRRVHPKASYKGVTSHFTTHLEMLVVIVEVVLLMGFAFPLWAKRVEDIPGEDDPNVVRIRAVAEQFRWNFHYAGADGRFGLVRPDQINGTNPVGLVKEDPNSFDDFLSNELILPKDRLCIVQVTSKDVIHNLALIPMRIQQDAIPGMEIPMYFTPIKNGRWDIVCAQLCGAGHAKMVAFLEVQEPDEFDSWFKQKTESAAAQAQASQEAAAQ